MSDPREWLSATEPSTPVAPQPEQPQLARRRHWPARLAGIALVLFMVSLVVGPIVYLGFPREMARWHLAAAIERRLNGDLDAAIRSLDHLIVESPDNDELLTERASWRLENREYPSALADANRALRIAPGNPQALVLRSQIFQHLERHADAIRDWNQLVAMAENGLGISLAAALNGRAYARALGRVELNEALADVEEALRREGENASMLDTRGYIRHQHGDSRGAIADLDKSVQLAEEEHEQNTKTMNAGRLGAVDPRENEFGLKKSAEVVAVIRYHRSLVYEQLGKTDLAEQDKRQVRKLGFTADKHLF